MTLSQNTFEILDLLEKQVLAEKQRITKELYDFQKTVSQFPTAKECIAYNKALRDFAEKLTNE